ncbi:MAG: cytochrome c oxidase accessory protein CcoG [Bacteroidetes bacterium]|nr:cytochrome c oxidase accessory protein CcoG [Bacteroidota bacterium]
MSENRIVEKMEKEKSFRDSVSTIDDKGKRVWITPQKPSGRHYEARKWVSYGCLAILFLIPFIKINGNPLLLLNVLERKFIIFGLIFWPQDFFLFGLTMLTFVVFIVLFTSIFGRLWCGWTCPQTVFMEMVFRRIEYLIEGDANQQKALNKSEWTSEKISKKTIKHIIFYVISFIIANTFLAYIIGIDELYKIATEPIGQHTSGFLAILIFSGVFYGVFAHFREQVCLVVCPYGRLQGVLLDKNSIVVAYDYVRGEPRKHLRKNEERNAGDCIDCHQCVKICPTGIDIRNGTQLECINCTACIDACDHIMDSVNLPKGLIRYASEDGIAKKQPLRFTTRIALYTALLTVLLIGLGTGIALRSDTETTILRTPGMLFQKQPDGTISNLYNFKIVNKTTEDFPLEFKLEGLNGNIKIVGDSDLKANNQAITEGEFFIIVDPSEIKQRKTKIKVIVYSGEKKIETVKTSFMGPGGKHQTEEHNEHKEH